MPSRAGSSLRLRLIVGAAVIALIAVFAAGLAVWGTTTTSRLIERAATAQIRIDLLSALSARVSDYAVVAVETTKPSVPKSARDARLASQQSQVEAAFASVDRALVAAVEESKADGEEEQMRRATRSLGVARMRAQFQSLSQAVDQTDESSALRVHLDGFATRFSPLVNEAIAEEQRDRNGSRAAVDKLQAKLIPMAVILAVIALGLVVLFYVFLVRPLTRQLSHIRSAAAVIGEGNFEVQLPPTSSRELNHVFSELSRTADRLKDRKIEVDRNRSELNQIIAARTSELEDANERLSRIDQDRRRFFADVGHELRTPLTVILAESELGLQGPLDPEDASESLKVIHARAKRLNRRIDDLLRVARSETGEIQLDPLPFDLAVCAENAVADVATLAKRRGISLETDLPPSPATGDSDWCRQVISGLIENALKHAASGSVVEVATVAKADQATLTVTDDGPGLTEKEIETVFNRFAQGSREAMGSGFGVGLALARWVIEGQSGTIDLFSPALSIPRGAKSAGRGVTVKISLPGGPSS
ncbi:MAG: HAMP domain-containing sensor histidine kinase [Pseudomonadota bacterium]